MTHKLHIGRTWGAIWKHALLIIIVAGFLAYGLWYSHRTIENVVQKDQWRLLGYVEKYFEGDLTPGDLWSYEGSHRIPFYRALFVVNAALLDLNTKAEHMFFLMWTVPTCFLLYGRYRTWLCGNGAPGVVVQLGFLFIALEIFSYNQINSYFYSVAASAFLTLFWFYVIMLMFDRMIVEKRPYTPWFSVILILTLLFIGSGFTPALIAAMLLTLLFKAVLERKLSREVMIAFGAVVITAAIGEWLYLMDFSGGIKPPVNLGDRIAYVMTHAGMAVWWMMGMLASSVVYNIFFVGFLGVIGVEGVDVNAVFPFFGFGVLALYVYAVVQFVRCRMWESTYMPIMLMLFSGLLMASVVVGRMGMPHMSWAYPRYIVVTHVGVIGFMWIMVSVTIRAALRKANRITIITNICIVLLFTLVEFSNLYAAERMSGSIKKTHMRMVEKALSGDFDEDDYRLFLCGNKNYFLKGMDILKTHRLSFFAGGAGGE